MAAFTAKDVAALREKTGCGMMDCKKALTEANGDMDAAIDFLREKGLAAATKKAGRIAAEGVAFACTNEAKNVGVAIEVNAETDFVAKNADFQNFVKTCARYGYRPRIRQMWKHCWLARRLALTMTVDALLQGEDPDHRREYQDSPFRAL